MQCALIIHLLYNNVQRFPDSPAGLILTQFSHMLNRKLLCHIKLIGVNGHFYIISILYGFLVLDPFKKPRLMKKYPCFLEKITVTMSPSVDKFEEDLCQQLNEDRINQENRVADGVGYTITERRLQVTMEGRVWGFGRGNSTTVFP